MDPKAKALEDGGKILTIASVWMIGKFTSLIGFLTLSNVALMVTIVGGTFYAANQATTFIRSHFRKRNK